MIDGFIIRTRKDIFKSNEVEEIYKYIWSALPPVASSAVAERECLDVFNQFQTQTRQHFIFAARLVYDSYIECNKQAMFKPDLWINKLWVLNWIFSILETQFVALDWSL